MHDNMLLATFAGPSSATPWALPAAAKGINALDLPFDYVFPQDGIATGDELARTNAVLDKSKALTSGRDALRRADGQEKNPQAGLENKAARNDGGLLELGPIEIDPYDTRREVSRIANARVDVGRLAQSDRLGDWIRSLELPEIPGVGWLSREQAVSASQYWATRLDETGNVLYAVPQGVATLWAEHAERVGVALAVRGGGRGVRAGDSGAFGSLKGTKGDGLTAHHMPQAAAGRTGYNEGGGLVLTHAEHVMTRTYGSKGMTTLQSDARLSFREVLARDMADIRRIVGSKYNEGLQNLADYYRKAFPGLMKR